MTQEFLPQRQEGISMGGFELDSVCPALDIAQRAYSYTLTWPNAEVIGSTELRLQFCALDEEGEEEEGFF